MNKNLKKLIALGLDLDLFYNLSISKYEVVLQSHNTEDLRNHLVEKGFTKFNYLYTEDNVENSEYCLTEPNVRVVLIGKEARF